MTVIKANTNWDECYHLCKHHTFTPSQKAYLIANGKYPVKDETKSTGPKQHFLCFINDNKHPSISSYCRWQLSTLKAHLATHSLRLITELLFKFYVYI